MPSQQQPQQVIYLDSALLIWIFLALALATGEKLFTDDYSLQNVCRSVNHPFEAVSNKRSRQQWSWELRCIGCRATKKADSQKEEECDICGSPMKVKRSRN
jgi:rRNA maturation endonuclease Nob1